MCINNNVKPPPRNPWGVKGSPKTRLRNIRRSIGALQIELESNLIGSPQDAVTAFAKTLPDLLLELYKMARGKPAICPFCKKAHPRLREPDREALFYALDRILGKVRQIAEVDITQRIELSADQCLALLEKAKQADLDFQKSLALPKGETISAGPTTALLRHGKPGRSGISVNRGDDPPQTSIL